MLDLLESAITERYNPVDQDYHVLKRTKNLDGEAVSTGKQIKFLRFDGSMTQAQRSNAIQFFQDDPEIKILLVSLK